VTEQSLPAAAAFAAAAAVGYASILLQNARTWPRPIKGAWSLLLHKRYSPARR